MAPADARCLWVVNITATGKRVSSRAAGTIAGSAFRRQELLRCSCKQGPALGPWTPRATTWPRPGGRADRWHINRGLEQAADSFREPVPHEFPGPISSSSAETLGEDAAVTRATPRTTATVRMRNPQAPATGSTSPPADGDSFGKPMINFNLRFARLHACRSARSRACRRRPSSGGAGGWRHRGQETSPSSPAGAARDATLSLIAEQTNRRASPPKAR